MQTVTASLHINVPELQVCFGTDFYLLTYYDQHDVFTKAVSSRIWLYFLQSSGGGFYHQHANMYRFIISDPDLCV